MRIFGIIALILVVLSLGSSPVQAGEFYSVLYQRYCTAYSGSALEGCKKYLDCRITFGERKAFAISNCKGFCANMYQPLKGPNESAPCQASCQAMYDMDN